MIDAIKSMRQGFLASVLTAQLKNNNRELTLKTPLKQAITNPKMMET
jgi:hypothetical protein